MSPPRLRHARGALHARQVPHGRHAAKPYTAGAQERFIIDLYPAAVAVSAKTGMSWQLILAQAAQETGWGAKVLPGTHNLFNVKASPAWKGKSKAFTVPEYEQGRKVWVKAKFRVYSSYQDALDDRATFLRGNPRYTAAGLFKAGTKGDLRKEAEALQKGHYATDPHYADHIVEVFEDRTMQRALMVAEARAAAASTAAGAHPPASRH